MKNLIGFIILAGLVWACSLALVPAIDAELDAQHHRAQQVAAR